MTHLYNCKPIPGTPDFRITKFDADFVPEEGSSYITAEFTCTCPAGVRPTCRHRQMLPLFQARNHVGDGWFLDWDTRMWHRGVAEADLFPQTTETIAEGIAMALEPAVAPTFRRWV